MWRAEAQRRKVISPFNTAVHAVCRLYLHEHGRPTTCPQITLLHISLEQAACYFVPNIIASHLSLINVDGLHTQAYDLLSVI